MRVSRNIYQRIITVGEDAIEYQNTVWNDLTVAATATQVNPISSKPDFGAFPAGATYLKTYLFDGSARETVTFEKQLPHGWKQATSLHPHVHFAPTAVEVSKTITWELNYSFAEINNVFGSETAISATWGAADTVANKHLLLELPQISMTGVASVSGMMHCALSRRGDTDSFTADVAFCEFDWHLEFGRPGSRTEYVY